MTAPVNIQWIPKGGSQTDITASTDWTTLTLTSVVTKERGTLEFTILSTHWTTDLPAIADDVFLYDTSGVIFGGSVTERKLQQRKQEGGLLLEAQLVVTDYGFALDSKIVKTAYAQMDPADILADLVNTYGPGGFDVTTHVQRGNFLVRTISFNYMQLTKCIQKLATQIGWDWYVDPNKAIHFFFATTDSGSSEYNPAPITIDDTSGGINWNTLSIDVSISNMKNSVYVIGGTYEKNFTDNPLPNQNPPEYSPVDVYQTDGIKYAYPTAYRYTGSSIMAYLNGVQLSVGIDQQEDPSMYDCMYNTGMSFILFPTPPAAGQTLKIEGLAMVPIVAHVQDGASIASYGEYQDSITDSQITSVAQAQERARADIDLFGHAIYDVTFDTLETGLRVGQVITLNSTQYSVSNYPLVVKRIEAKALTPTKLIYTVECIGSDKVTFNDMMQSILLQQGDQTSVDPSTVLQVLLDVEETLIVADSVTISAASKPYRFDSARAGFAKAS